MSPLFGTGANQLRCLSSHHCLDHDKAYFDVTNYRFACHQGLLGINTSWRLPVVGQTLSTTKTAPLVTSLTQLHFVPTFCHVPIYRSEVEPLS